MDLADVMQEIADRLDVIDPLRTFGYPIDGTPPIPAAIVTWPESLTYDATYGRGMDRLKLPAVVLVGRVSERASRANLAAYMDGSGDMSIKEAIERDRIYHVAMPGAVGDYISTPDAAVLDVVQDLDLRVKARLTDWTPAEQTWLISKAPATGVQRSYALIVNTGGQLNLTWSPTGAGLVSEVSSVATGFVDGTTHWVRATLDVDNGAGDATVTFYTSDNGTTWTQLGTPQPVGAPTSIHAGSEPLSIGARTAGTTNLMVGRFYEAQVRAGIGGAIATHPVAQQNGVIDVVSGLPYTLNGAAALAYDETTQPTYTAFDTARLESAVFDVVRFGTVDYLAATLTIDITGQGA